MNTSTLVLGANSFSFFYTQVRALFAGPTRTSSCSVALDRALSVMAALDATESAAAAAAVGV